MQIPHDKAVSAVGSQEIVDLFKIKEKKFTIMKKKKCKF